MVENKFVVRAAESRDNASIAGLVVEGFLDKFRPVFGKRMDQAVKIMEKWVRLEHDLGGVSSLVIEGPKPGEVPASVGVRLGSSEDDALGRGLWKALRRHLGLLRAGWAATLLSYPRYVANTSEAYVERLVVSGEHRKRGMARALLEAAEALARESGKVTVGLHVTGGNVAALKLYESYGYEERSRQRSLLTGYFLGIREWLYLQKRL
ncbi:MAG TPA: GNAT family N-acetyltransferase [Rubrobacteraceae bacterium]|jgi:ribosomal protein S18 acetylase RimI-like enzyme